MRNEKDSGIYDLDKRYEYIFVDVPGKLDNNLPVEQQEITKYLQVTDYLFIPFLPGGLQMEATLEFIKIAIKIRSQRKKDKRPLHLYGFVNMFEQRTLDDRFLLEEIEELRDMINIHFMESKLNRYTIYRNTDTLGSFYLDDPKGKAEQNFKTWFNEFYKIINNG